MKTYTLLAALLAGLALLTITTGCSPLVSAETNTQPAKLDGTSWTLAALNGQELLAGSEITLDVDGDRLAGAAGCNQYFGSLTFADSTLSADGALSAGTVGSSVGVGSAVGIEVGVGVSRRAITGEGASEAVGTDILT